MFNSWIFWLAVLFSALSIGVLLSWLERKPGKNTFIGQPSKYPSELVNKLKEYFKTQNGIESAYLAQILNGSNNDPPHPIVGIGTDDDFDRIRKECASITGKISGEDSHVDFILLGEDEISEYMKNQTKPFYGKQLSST